MSDNGASSEQCDGRICSSCREHKNEAEFGYDRYRCLSCIRQRIRDYRARRRPQREAQAEPAERRTTNIGPREYVLTRDLAAMVEAYLSSHPLDGPTRLCERAGIDRRVLREVRAINSAYVSISIADRLCVAMNSHLSYLETVMLNRAEGNFAQEVDPSSVRSAHASLVSSFTP